MEKGYHSTKKKQGKTPIYRTKERKNPLERTIRGKKQPPKKRQKRKCPLLPNKASKLRIKKKMKQGNLTRSPLLAIIHPCIQTGIQSLIA